MSNVTLNDDRIKSPTDVYNYAINNNAYYNNIKTREVDKRTPIDNTINNDDKTTLDKMTEWLLKAENNKQKIYPFAILILAAIPVLLVLCTSTVSFYTKTLTLLVYLIMIAFTIYLFKK